MAIEIVDLPIFTHVYPLNVVIFHSCLYVYQRVRPNKNLADYGHNHQQWFNGLALLKLDEHGLHKIVSMTFSGGCIAAWWFGTCFIFPYIGDDHHPN